MDADAVGRREAESFTEAGQIFDAVIAWDTERQRIAAARERLIELRRRATPRCGSCSLWLKSQECPRERNVNGWNRGPSSGDQICQQFQPSREHDDAVAAYKSALEEPAHV